MPRASPRSVRDSNKDFEHISLSCALRFHQSLLLPASHSQNPTATPKVDFRVSYGIAGLNSDELIVHGDSAAAQPRADADAIAKTPTVLVMGGMFCTRYWLICLDRLARDKGVRVIYADRPGMGASTSVPLPQRMETWQATMTLLLDRLKIRHCVFMSHSAGTMYLLNSLYRYGAKYLSPTRPYVALLAPWVHPTHSSVGIWRFCASPMLPIGAINYLSGLQNFVVKNVMPSVAWSGGVLSALSPATSSSSTSPDGVDAAAQADAGAGTGAGAEGRDSIHRGSESNRAQRKRRREEAAFGMLSGEIRRLESTLRGFSCEESNKGGNEDAMLCLKKLKDKQTGKDHGWGFADDYKEYAAMLNQHLRETSTKCSNSNSNSSSSSNGSSGGGGGAGGGHGGGDVSESVRVCGDKKMTKETLRIETFFAASDAMIGDKGARYFDDCFQQVDDSHGHDHRQLQQSGEAGKENGCFYQYTSHIIAEEDHDSLFLPGSAALNQFFENVVWSLGP